MTYFEDLSRYEYLPVEQEMLNVGWLSRDHSFPQGEADPRLVEALVARAADPQHITRGVHDCEFCTAESPLRIPADVPRGFVSLGFAELHVEGENGTVYAAPSLVVHYVEAHGYQPPQEFVDAVLRDARTRPD